MAPKSWEPGEFNMPPGGARGESWPIQDIRSLQESIILVLHPPPALPTLLQYYCATIAQYTPPARPLLCMPHTVRYWIWQYVNRCIHCTLRPHRPAAPEPPSAKMLEQGEFSMPPGGAWGESWPVYIYIYICVYEQALVCLSNGE